VMAACQEIKTIDNVQDELNRVRDLVRIIYASVTSRDCGFSEIESGLLWVVSDIEDNIDRILAGLQKFEEART
jgi:hypothetical protein